MATRINTKFVIILAVVLVAMTGGGVFAFMQLQKSAEQFAQIGEAAMAEADTTLASGDAEQANELYRKAAKNFAKAKGKAPQNTSYVLRFIDAHNSVICEDQTPAYNQLNEVLRGAFTIHDTPGATVEDRTYVYELLYDRVRMQMVVNKVHPLSNMLSASSKRLAVQPDDPVAKKYSAIAKSYIVEQETSDEERRELLQTLGEVAQAEPDDPRIQLATARYHVGEARRLYRASGGAFTPEVNSQYKKAYEHLNKAIPLAQQDAPSMVDALGIVMDLRSDDEAFAPQVIEMRLATAGKLSDMLKDKAMRDQLFGEELNRAAQYIWQMGTGTEKQPFNGKDLSIELARAVVADRPDEPLAYASLGALLRDAREFDEAGKVIEKGLAIDRLTTGREFVRDMQSRLDMFSTLAEVKIVQAGLARGDKEARTARLVEAGKLIEQLINAPTTNIDRRDARAQFLRGRIDLADGQPKQAVGRFEKANAFYNGRDLQTLTFLAETHRQLGNTTLVIDYFEQVVALQPNSPLRLNLVNLYLNQRGDQDLDKAEVHLKQFLNQFPGNLAAIRLSAELLNQRDQVDQAIALLQQQDLEAHPELKAQIINYRAQAGDTEQAIALQREQLANRAEGSKMNLSMVTQLINTLPTIEDKLAELDRLEADGLDKSIADILRAFSRNGRLSMEDELALLDAQAEMAPAAKAVNRFLIFQRYDDPEKARAELDKAVKLDPDLPMVIEWRFRLALQDQRWEEADAAIQDMLDLDVDQRPDIALAGGAFMRAKLLAAQGASMERGITREQKLREAAVAYSQALQEYSHYIDGWVELGRIQLYQENYFAAQESLREALSRQSQNIDALEIMARSEVATGDEGQALERFEQILRLRPTHPTALDQFTALAQRMGVPGRAINQRELIRERLPNKLDNRRTLALLYAQDGEQAKARAEIDSVISMEGKTRQNLAILSQILTTTDKSDEAISVVTAYLAERGDDADWQDQMLVAATYEGAGKPQQADTHFAKAVQLQGDEGNAAAKLSWAQTLQNRGELKRAADLYEQMAERFPANSAIKGQAVRIYIQLSDFDKAEALVKTLDQSPERYLLLTQIALGREDGRLDAVKSARAGVKAYPTSLGLRLQLGQLLLDQERSRSKSSQNFGEVSKLAEQLHQDHPDRVDVKMLLADVQLAMNRRDEAVATLEKILEFAPRHLRANERLYGLRMAEAQALAPTDQAQSREVAAEALGIVALLIQSRPDIALLYRTAGEAASMAGMGQQAADYFRQAFAKTGEVTDLASYCTTLLSIGRARDARSVLESSDNAKLVSENLFLRALRGRALAATGDTATAETLFKNLLRDHQDPPSRLMLARQITGSFANDPQRAEQVLVSQLGDDLPVEVDSVLATMFISQRYYKQAADRLAKYAQTPASPVDVQFRILLQLALAQQESDQLDASKGTYELAYQLMKANDDKIPDGTKVQMLNNMAYLLVDKLSGYEDQGIEYARQAMGLLPETESNENRALIEDTLGWALFKAGKLDESVRTLQRSVKNFPLVANQLHLGRAYLSRGEKDRALLVLESALNQARAQKDQAMIEEVEKWYREAL